MSAYNQAHALMLAALMAGREAGKTPEQIARTIQQCFPFGERKGHAYRAWLKCWRAFAAHHGLPRRTSRPPQDDLAGGFQQLTTYRKPWALLRAFGPACYVRGPVNVADLKPSELPDVVGRFADFDTAKRLVDFDRQTAEQVARLLATRRYELQQMIDQETKGANR